MLEEHSVGLLVTSVVAVVVYFFGLIFNLSSLTAQYSSAQLIPGLFRGDVFSKDTSPYVLPVSLPDWSTALWGVVYIFQFSWLLYAMTAICRQTALGPAYNNPKLLPVQVHLFFSIAVLTQTSWLVALDREHLPGALMCILLATGCTVAALAASYRALSTAQPILLQEGRFFDLWAIRLLAQNALALFLTWVVLHMTLTFAFFLTFASESSHVSERTASLVELCCAGFLIFVYILSDLTIFEKFSRYTVLPYVGFGLFHAAQLNKNWPGTHDPVFVLLAALTAFTFLFVLVKVIFLVCRHVPNCIQTDNKVVITRPLGNELEVEEGTYLLQQK